MDSLLSLSSGNDECLPIKTLEELMSWKSCKVKKHSSHSLQKRATTCAPKTLICHDMKGGYLEDRYLNGSETEDNYYFLHWSMVDVFVYFSHYLVTIPPCSWITAAHRHGVKVLGTFITEWDAGKEVCDGIFCDVETVHQICHQLVNIAKFYQFDGWLINIENKLTQSQVPLLEEFVRVLTLKMHELNLGSLVIWYDSVIQSGDLKWQNELNENNRNFFQACDGIFLNYNWKNENLKKSVEEAGPRRTDVYVGVDVFGRGCLGGGGFSTDIAVTAARDFNLSVAIFAPGWVHECLDCKNFAENQYRFWHSLTELCAPRRLESLPYYSSFCPGFGKKMYRNGNVISDRQWYNISLQQLQPSYHYTNNSSDESISVYSEDAFNGGGCLELKSKSFDFCKSLEFEILACNFLINTDCNVSYTFKAFDKDIKVALIFCIYNEKKLRRLNFVEELEADEEETFSNFCSSCITSDVHKVLASSTRTLAGSTEDPPWIQRNYKMICHPNENYYIKNINLQLSWKSNPVGETSVLLGELSISPVPCGTFFTYKDLNVEPNDESSFDLECFLEWTPDISIVYSDLYILADDIKSHICTTSQFYYEFKGSIKKLPEIEFILNPKHVGRASQPIFLRVPLTAIDC